MKYKGYLVADYDCKGKKCFVPFEGNGIKICRKFELGQCPEPEKEIKTSREEKNESQKRTVGSRR